MNGELLSFINQREIFDHKATLFYAAEILLALEHLHRYDIVHRYVFSRISKSFRIHI